MIIAVLTPHAEVEVFKVTDNDRPAWRKELDKLYGDWQWQIVAKNDDPKHSVKTTGYFEHLITIDLQEAKQ